MSWFKERCPHPCAYSRAHIYGTYRHDACQHSHRMMHWGCSKICLESSINSSLLLTSLIRSGRIIYVINTHFHFMVTKWFPQNNRQIAQHCFLRDCILTHQIYEWQNCFMYNGKLNYSRSGNLTHLYSSWKKTYFIWVFLQYDIPKYHFLFPPLFPHLYRMQRWLLWEATAFSVHLQCILKEAERKLKRVLSALLGQPFCQFIPHHNEVWHQNMLGIYNHHRNRRKKGHLSSKKPHIQKPPKWHWNSQFSMVPQWTASWPS
jgi:hypothetical protein